MGLLDFFSDVHDLVTVAEDVVPQHGTYAAVLHGLSHGRKPEVHVVEGGGAAGEHFATGLEGALIDQLVGEFLFGRPDVFIEPYVERLVVAQAAEEGHGGMGVHVAQSGKDG